MPKYRYRVPPCPAYDIPAMDSWLEDMAARGLHLSSEGFFMGIGTFTEGPPRRERFRLEPTATKKGLLSDEYDPTSDAVETHRQMGWYYRGRRDQFHIYSSADPEAPELNTDPQVQAITMAALTKHLRGVLLHTLFLLTLYTLLYFGDMVISAAIWLGTWRIGLLLGLLVWGLVRQIRTLAVLTRFRRSLQLGESLPHRIDYRRNGRRHLAFGAVRKILWAVVVLSITARMLPMLTEESHVSLDKYEPPLPFATLADLYPGAKVTRHNGILTNQIYGWEDSLAPENYDFTEYAQITHDGKTFDCHLTVEYHRTRWEWTAQVLAREMTSQAGSNFFEQSLARLMGGKPVTLTEIPLPGADYCAYYCRDLPDPYLVIQYNEVVLRVRCTPHGQAPALEPQELASLVLSRFR